MPRVILPVYHRLDDRRELVEERRLETASHKRLTGSRARQILRRAFPEARLLTGPIRTEEGWKCSRALEPKPNCAFHYTWVEYVVSEDTSSPLEEWTGSVSYVHLPAASPPPRVTWPTPFIAVLVLEQAVAADWQAEISRWLVASGCLFALAWGVECSSWDTSIDMANLETFDFGEVPDESFVMTTWHDDEPLEEALWYAKYNAFHPVAELDHHVLVHVAPAARPAELIENFCRA